MAFDLGRAMRKKEEFESARLADFGFRVRARATRALALHYGLMGDAAAGLVAAGNDEAVIARVAALAGAAAIDVTAAYARVAAEARVALTAERGDRLRTGWRDALAVDPGGERP